MKPSEYLFNEAINSVENRKKDFYLGLLEYNEFGEDISTYKFNRKQEKELDKRFIDREDLEMRKRFDSYTSPYTNQGEKLYRDVLKIQKLEKDAVDKYKKELKDKINEIDIWNKNGLKVKKEILGLLK